MIKDVPICRVCDNPIDNSLFVAREMMQGTRKPFDYFTCSACGSVQIAELPAAMDQYYENGYYSFGSDLDAQFADGSERAERIARVNNLLTLPASKAIRIAHADMKRPLLAVGRVGLKHEHRVLDVGCGDGRLLYQLHEAGWTNCVGIDAFLPFSRTYKNGLEIVRGSLDNVDGRFDLIMLHHVFEHMSNPIEALGLIADRLHQHGTCLIRMPMADSHAFATYGANWVQLDAPRHLQIHTRRSIEIASERAGLRIAAVTYDSYDLQFWGSEQYKMDIPLQSPESYRWGLGSQLFSKEQIAVWQVQSNDLNLAERGDQAAVYLRHR